MKLHKRKESCATGEFDPGSGRPRPTLKWIDFRFGVHLTQSEHAWIWLHGHLLDRLDESDLIYNNEVWIEMLFDDYLNRPLYECGDSDNYKRASKSNFTRI